MVIQLTGNYTLSIEPHLNGARLIVLDNGKEWVCRKETLKKLADFMAQEEASIFKGRLQLYKHDDVVAVQVKGISIGTVSAKYLSGFFQSAKALH